MIPIKGLSPYGYEDGKVWNMKTKKPLKGAVHYGVNYVLLRNSGKSVMYPVPKLAFCVAHGVSPDIIPKGLQFVIENDGNVRLSNATERNVKRSKTIARFKASSIEKIDKEIEWLQLQKAFLQGENVESDILVFLTNTAEEIEPYLLKVMTMKVSPVLIKDYILEAVDLCYQKITENHTLINSPRRWLSFAVRNIVSKKEIKKSLVK